MTRPRVVATAPLDRHAEGWLAANTDLVYVPDLDDARARSDAALADGDILIVRSNITVDATLLDRHPRLALVIRAGAGMENIDTETLAARGVRIDRLGSDASGRSVAELALAMALSLLRRVPEASYGIAHGEWRKGASLGEEIGGLRVAVWGHGPVGRAVLDLFASVGAETAVHALDAPPNVARTPAELVEWARLHVLALPLTPETRHLIAGDRLNTLAGRNSYIVNVGRWDLIDVPAALQELAAGRLAGLAIDPVERRHLDVCRGHEHLNLVLTPHVGAMTHQAQKRFAEQIIDRVERFTAVGV